MSWLQLLLRLNIKSIVYINFLKSLTHIYFNNKLDNIINSIDK